jgi:hypothetical protein
MGTISFPEIRQDKCSISEVLPRGSDLNEVYEAAAAVLLPYFLEGRAKSGLSSRMKHIPAFMAKFPAAVQWLFQSFATEAVIAASYQKIFTARQSVEEDEKQFASRLT